MHHLGSRIASGVILVAKLNLIGVFGCTCGYAERTVYAVQCWFYFNEAECGGGGARASAIAWSTHCRFASGEGGALLFCCVLQSHVRRWLQLTRQHYAVVHAFLLALLAAYAYV